MEGERPSPVMEVRVLVKDFPEVRAVDAVSFATERGTCFGLLGPNGAGKTTALEVRFSLEWAGPWVRKRAGAFPLAPMIDAARKVTSDGAGIFVGPQRAVMTPMPALFLPAGSPPFSWRGR